MNTTKKINVNFSSLVGLKAELLRKQTEVNEIRLKSETSHNIPKVKKKLKKAKEENKNEDSKNSEYIEDISTYKKSKLMLEAKSRLYDRLKKSKNNDDNILVDFANKSDESEEESTLKDEEEENDDAFGNEDDWVEYEDCFGRTRKCLREDLHFMQEKDNLLKQQIINKMGVDPLTKCAPEQNFIEDKKEPEIEIMRRKWEDQTKKLTDKVNIHYQDILFDEARTHGVGYYAFSQDEEERIKQQENLFSLRKETKQKQKEIQDLKELRKKMEQNRLKAAKIRQRIRAGLSVDSFEEDEPECKDKTESNINTSESTTQKQTIEIEEDKSKEESEKAKIMERENKIKAFEDLLGKKNYWYEMSQEEWVHKCRKIRVTEFGPIYDDFKSAGCLNPTNINTSVTVPNSNEPELNKVNTHDEIENDNLTNTDFYDIPLPPISTHNHNTDCNNISAEDNSVTTNVQHESNDIDNTVENQIKLNRNIDEASITAGLRYLRRKFEESQNT